MNNTFKDNERYPMNQTMSDVKAMQLKIGKEFTLTDLIMHKLVNKSAESMMVCLTGRKTICSAVRCQYF